MRDGRIGVVVFAAAAFWSSLGWAAPACGMRAAQMRQALERVAKSTTAGELQLPSSAPGWLQELVEAFRGEPDATKRAVLVANSWPRAIGEPCRESFARAFADTASLDGPAKMDKLQRSIPDALLACKCQGADPEAIEVLALLGLHAGERRGDVAAPSAPPGAGPPAAKARASAAPDIEKLIRKRGSLYRLARGDAGATCQRSQFRPGRKPGKGRIGAYDYEYADGTLTLSGPSGGDVGLGCFFSARLAPAGADAVMIDGEKVFLTPAACEAARGAPPEPVKHECMW